MPLVEATATREVERMCVTVSRMLSSLRVESFSLRIARGRTNDFPFKRSDVRDTPHIVRVFAAMEQLSREVHMTSANTPRP